MFKLWCERGISLLRAKFGPLNNLMHFRLTLCPSFHIVGDNRIKKDTELWSSDLGSHPRRILGQILDSQRSSPWLFCSMGIGEFTDWGGNLITLKWTRVPRKS